MKKHLLPIALVALFGFSACSTQFDNPEDSSSNSDQVEMAWNDSKTAVTVDNQLAASGIAVQAVVAVESEPATTVALDPDKEVVETTQIPAGVKEFLKKRYSRFEIKKIGVDTKGRIVVLVWAEGKFATFLFNSNGEQIKELVLVARQEVDAKVMALKPVAWETVPMDVKRHVTEKFANSQIRVAYQNTEGNWFVFVKKDNLSVILEYGKDGKFLRAFAAQLPNTSLGYLKGLSLVDLEKLPAAIREFIKEKNPYSKPIAAAVDADGRFLVAVTTVNGNIGIHVFTKEGQWVALTAEFKSSETGGGVVSNPVEVNPVQFSALPETILAFIKREFPNSKLVESARKGDFFHVVIHNGEYPILLVFDATGKFIRKEALKVSDQTLPGKDIVIQTDRLPELAAKWMNEHYYGYKLIKIEGLNTEYIYVHFFHSDFNRVAVFKANGEFVKQAQEEVKADVTIGVVNPDGKEYVNLPDVTWEFIKREYPLGKFVSSSTFLNNIGELRYKVVISSADKLITLIFNKNGGFIEIAK